MPPARAWIVGFAWLLLVPSLLFAYGLDEEFGIDGIASFAPGFTAKGVLVAPDGRIVAVGGSSTESFIAQVLADGTSDPSFGGTGTVTTSLVHEARSVARQADGKLLIAGNSAPPEENNFAVARWLDDGTLDPTFGDGGIANVNAGGTDIAYQIVVQPDGKIVVGGRSDRRLALARLETGGTPDLTFGAQGVVRGDEQRGAESAFRMALQPDGKIVVGGPTDRSNGGGMAVERYDSDGVLDAGFGDGGRVVLNLGRTSTLYGVALQRDGKILVTGEGGPDKTVPYRFPLLRLMADGTPDPAFGNGKPVFTDVHQDTSIYGIVVGPDGTIAVGGYGTGIFARFRTDGTLLRRFGVCGTAISEIATYALAQEPSGSVIVAGYYQGSAALGRFNVAAPAICAQAPLAGCKTGSTRLALADRGGKGDKIAWQLKRGDATTLAELGHPTTTDDYTLCLYDESQPISDLVYAARSGGGGMCNGKPCWTISEAGFSYADKEASPCGVEQLTLTSGPAGATRVSLKGKGAKVGVPALPFPLPLRAQLQSANGTCWEATYSTPDVQRNDATSFKASSD